MQHDFEEERDKVEVDRKRFVEDCKRLERIEMDVQRLRRHFD